MLFKKKINNNAVLALDDEHQEVILIGLGIGFNVGINKEIEQHRIEKKFILESERDVHQFIQLLKEIPESYLKFSDKAVKYIEQELSVTLSNSLYLSLTDHIASSIKRNKESIYLKNFLLEEIKVYYEFEYKVALTIIKNLNRQFDTDLNNHEAAYLVFHIINGTLDKQDNNPSLKVVTMIKDITQVITKAFDIVMNKNNYEYQRLLIHIRFLVQRVFMNKYTPQQKLRVFDEDFYLSKTYIKTKKILNEVGIKYGFTIDESEIDYLTLHIFRLQQRRVEQ